MADDIVRIRLTRLPSVRDLEYFALRYLTVNGVYEVDLALAQDLVEFGYATIGAAAEPLSRIGDVPELTDESE